MVLAPWKKSCDKPRQCIKKQRHYFANKGLYIRSYGFPSSHVWIWELDYKEGWVLKNWCFQTAVLEKTLRVPWSTRRSNQSILKEINSEYLLEGLMLKLSFNTLATWCKEPTQRKRSSCWERLRAGKGTTEDEMVAWHHRLNGYEFEQSSRSWWWTGKPGMLQSMG